MTLALRPYQSESIQALFAWWNAHPGFAEIPVLVAPTGAGKSILAAEIARVLFDRWPEHHPRTVVLVPSKELAEQNAAKLAALLPSHLSIGYYSAAIGQKRPDADVIVATIGSIYKDALRLGNIRCVIIDEAHLVNPGATDAGRYRKFITDLTKVCAFRVVGMTATPFRGNGVWITDGEDPLFTGIAHTIKIRDLLDAGHLAPLVRPADDIRTRIDTSGIATSSGDFNVGQLSARVDGYISSIAEDAVQLAAQRRKWIAFTASVANAQALAAELNQRGAPTAVVTGETPNDAREAIIEQFRAGRLRCLVTVLALAVGFDVPDVDCVIWARPTRSPVLYVQGAGRGLRTAPGKVDCLWLDFSDTTERLGPVDLITGRAKAKRRDDQGAPYAICPECGDRVTPASLERCPSCGALLREPEQEHAREVSNAAVMASQVGPKVITYPVTDVRYSLHSKAGSADSLRVDYFSGIRRVASEWVCLGHSGYARQKAEAWWQRRAGIHLDALVAFPANAHTAIDWIRQGLEIARPTAVIVNETGKYPELITHLWSEEREPSAV